MKNLALSKNLTDKLYLFLAHPAFRPRLGHALVLRQSSVVCRLSTIHKKCYSSLNFYPISILFGLFERACACALHFLPDFTNFNYYLTYDLIKT